MKLAYEISWPPAPDAVRLKNDLYVRLDVSQPLDVALIASLPKGSTPILFYPGQNITPARISTEALAGIQKSHETWAQALKNQGFSRMVLAADNDGAYQKILSPRFSEKPWSERMAPLLITFAALGKETPGLMVMVCVEELAPGGLDATDGVALGQALADLGLKTIIATAGTRDFMPLYNRRMTQKKRSADESFYSNEPSLACSLWLKEHTDLAVYCAGFFDDEQKALTLARELGLLGIIQKLSDN